MILLPFVFSILTESPTASLSFCWFIMSDFSRCEFLARSSQWLPKDTVSSELMDPCPSHLALFYQTQHKAWPLLFSMMFEHYLSWVELTRVRLSCPFLFGSFTNAIPIESFARLIYSLQNNWYDIFVLARSWKEAAENIQLKFATSIQTAFCAIYIIVDALVSCLGHKKLKLHDFRRIIHKVLNISTYHYLQRNTGLRIPTTWPHKKRWNKHELRNLENLSLITQHLHFVWVLFPEVHHFLTCFRSALRSTLDRVPKCCITPRYQVIRQTWCSLIPYLSPSDVTMLSMTRHVLLHLHRQMEATYALLTRDGFYFPPPQKKIYIGGGGSSFTYHQS